LRKSPVTIIMITLNEEDNLPGAIESVKNWAEEIFIVDSCSTDKTVDIALKQGVKIIQRPFTNFGDQWNFALKRLPIKTDWTLKLDPDERLSPGLIDELWEMFEGKPDCYGYIMDRRLWFMGKPLHILAPVLRLWRTGKCRFSDVIVNEHPIVNGPIGKLKGILEHFDSPNLHHWYNKQNRYSTMEAIMRAKGASLAVKPRLFGNALERRMFLKKHFSRIPFRFQLLYLHEVFIRGAWQDGSVGLAWAHLHVELMRAIELKVKEMKITGKIPDIPKTPHGDFDQRLISSKLQAKSFSEE